MSQISPQTIYDNLELMEKADVAEAAVYRQQAVEALADPELSLEWRKAIAERLNRVNNELTIRAVDRDSY